MTRRSLFQMLIAAPLAAVFGKCGASQMETGVPLGPWPDEQFNDEVSVNIRIAYDPASCCLAMYQDGELVCKCVPNQVSMPIEPMCPIYLHGREIHRT